ncbi:MAG: glycosyltransferase [Flavobacterium sp.]|nr:MAG: glycosyltransferase [Flavobacterium sp.]
MRKKLAIVVQRYGTHIIGGAEAHAATLAQLLSRSDFEIEILTTTSKSYQKWANDLPEGKEVINQFTSVRRFLVLKKSRLIFAFYKRLHLHVFSRLFKKSKYLNYLSEKIWLVLQGPYSPNLIKHLKKNSKEYDAIIFFSYLYYTTVFGLASTECKTILIPTAHDELPLHFDIMKKMFTKAEYIFANSKAEKRLLSHIQAEITDKISVVGIPVANIEKNPTLSESGRGNYFLYLGRISRGKNSNLLIEYFKKWVISRKSSVKLVLAGLMEESFELSEAVIFKGAVDENEKNNLIESSLGLINPSSLESLSLVTLEGMSSKKPVIINGASEVLRDYASKFPSVIAFYNYSDFAEALDKAIAGFTNSELDSAKDWVQKQYSEDVIFNFYRNVLK